MAERGRDAENDAFLAAITPAAALSGAEHGVSTGAALLCSRFFATGAKCSVRTHPPHAVLEGAREAFDELVAKGILTVEPFNGHDVWTYTGSDASRAIAAPVQAAGMKALLGA